MDPSTGSVSGCSRLNPFHHKPTAQRKCFAITCVALSAMTTAIGILAILSAMGICTVPFNVINSIKMAGGIACTGVGLPTFVTTLLWLCKKRNTKALLAKDEENKPPLASNDDVIQML